jgi:hypothetical protein
MKDRNGKCWLFRALLFRAQQVGVLKIRAGSYRRLPRIAEAVQIDGIQHPRGIGAVRPRGSRTVLQ